MSSYCIVFVSLFTLNGMVDSSFNLYIGVEEVKTLLGLSNELYYVREGVPNIYALQFTVPVPPHVDALHFTWQTLGQKPLPYTAEMQYSKSAAMLKPSLNISSKGIIPTGPQIFQIHFPCTGTVSDEVNFQLTLNITSMTHQRSFDVTTIFLKRKRICLKDAQKTRPVSATDHPHSRSHLAKMKTSRKNSLNARAGEVDIKNKSGITQNLNLADKENHSVETTNSDLIYILMGTSCGIILLIILFLGFIIFVHVRKQKVTQTAESTRFLHVDTSGTASSASCGSTFGGNMFIRPDSRHHYSSVSPTDLHLNSSYCGNTLPIYSEISSSGTQESNTNNSDDYKSHPSQKIFIDRHRVYLQGMIMEGSYARIQNGVVLEKDGAEQKVIVKTLKDSPTPVQMALLLEDGLSLVGMCQQLIATPIGVVAHPGATPLLIYADEGFRNLKKFLERCRCVGERSISSQEVVHIAIQIGSGIAFLHRQNVIHKDVATRNCIVDDKLMAKVCDSALARDLFPDDYQSIGFTKNKPIKWSSPEVITYDKTSVQADMWSFGVLLWELSALAQQPYAEIEFTSLLGFLRRGYRLTQPQNCPDGLYSIMIRSWTWSSEDRPKWSQTLPELQELYAHLISYM